MQLLIAKNYLTRSLSLTTRGHIYLLKLLRLQASPALVEIDLHTITSSLTVYILIYLSALRTLRRTRLRLRRLITRQTIKIARTFLKASMLRIRSARTTYLTYYVLTLLLTPY